MDRPHPAAGSPAWLVCRRGRRGPRGRSGSPWGPCCTGPGHKGPPHLGCREPSGPEQPGCQHTPLHFEGPGPRWALQPETANRAPALPTPPQRPSLSLRPAPADTVRAPPHGLVGTGGGRLSINRDCDGCCRFCIALPSPPPSPTGRRFLLQMQSSSAARRPCTPLWLWPAFVPAPAQTGPRAVPTGSQAGSGAQVGCLVPPAGLTPSGQRREGALPLSSRPCSAQLLPQSCPEHIGGSRTYTQALPGPQ